MTKLTLALWQLAPRPWSREKFLRALEEAMAQTAADVFITPELCWPGYGDVRSSRSEAVAQTSPLIAAVRAIAARHRRGIVLGYAETSGAEVFNSAICIDADGAILANYRKQTTANDYERACFGKGDHAPVFLLRGVQTSVLICLDVEFPELVRRASRDGAYLLIVPTALAPRWGIVPEMVIPTRAYENGIFVAYCNYAGEGDAGPFCGQSLVAGPDGRTIARARSTDCLMEATVESDRVAEARSHLDYLQHLDLLRC